MSYSTKRLAEIEAEQKLIDQQLADIEALDEPEGDEVARSKALEERSTETDDLIARFEALETEKAPLIERANKLNAVREAAKDIARTESGDGTRYLGGSGPAFNKKIDPFEGEVRSLSKSDAISRAMHVIDREKRVPVSDANKGHLEAMLHRSDTEEDAEFQFDGSYIARRTLLTENPMYRSAFQKYVRMGRDAAFTADEQKAVAAYQDYEIRRAMSENTTTAGGFGLPVLVDPTIILTSGSADVPMLRLCRIETITTNLWSGVSSAGMVWSYSTEGTEASDNSPTLAQPQVRIHMAKGFIPYSIEVSMDYPSFATRMGELLDQGYNDLRAVKTMTGSGSTEPFGVFTALDANTFDEVVTTTDGSFGGEDIFKVWNALPERFRANATWLMSVSVQSKIRQFAASQSSTSAYFTIDMTGGVFRINDRPVVLTDYAPSFASTVPGTTGAANILAVGDWRQAYLYVQRAGMSVEQIPHLFGGSNRFPTGQRGLYAWARDGANVVANNAGRLLQNQ